MITEHTHHKTHLNVSCTRAQHPVTVTCGTLTHSQVTQLHYIRLLLHVDRPDTLDSCLVCVPHVAELRYSCSFLFVPHFQSKINYVSSVCERLFSWVKLCKYMWYMWGAHGTLNLAALVQNILIRKYEGKSLNNRNFFSKVHGKVCTTKNLISGHKMAP